MEYGKIVNNLYISATVAASIDDKAKYILNKGFDEEAYRKWIVSYLKSYKRAKKQDFVDLLAKKLPDSLDEKQKKNKVRNLLQKMKQEGIITTDSPNKRLANWILTK